MHRHLKKKQHYTPSTSYWLDIYCEFEIEYGGDTAWIIQMVSMRLISFDLGQGVIWVDMVGWPCSVTAIPCRYTQVLGRKEAEWYVEPPRACRSHRN
jgi:hypothetical protein